MNAGPRAGLAVLGSLVVLGFAWQHARSPFLRIEREREVAARLAARIQGVDRFDVLALRELAGVDVAVEALEPRVREFARARAEFDGVDELAILAFVGRAALAADLMVATDRDPRSAAAMLSSLPDALHGVRFLTTRARYQERSRSWTGP